MTLTSGIPVSELHDPGEAERLRTAAGEARRRASSARELALDIERRRGFVLQRDDAPVAHHTAEVWASRAATASRTELQREVGRSLWLAAESLRDTRVALEQHASQDEALARNYERRADSSG